MSPEGYPWDLFRALLYYAKMGCCQIQHHFGTNQELLKENLLLDDITLLILHYTGSGPEIKVSPHNSPEETSCLSVF
jgi:hypothetical protein